MLELPRFDMPGSRGEFGVIPRIHLGSARVGLMKPQLWRHNLRLHSSMRLLVFYSLRETSDRGGGFESVVVTCASRGEFLPHRGGILSHRSNSSSRFRTKAIAQA